MRTIIEIIIRAAMFLLSLAVKWRMTKMGYAKDGHTWNIQREKITLEDPTISVTVRHSTAVLELAKAAINTLYK